MRRFLFGLILVLSMIKTSTVVEYLLDQENIQCGEVPPYGLVHADDLLVKYRCTIERFELSNKQDYFFYKGENSIISNLTIRDSSIFFFPIKTYSYLAHLEHLIVTNTTLKIVNQMDYKNLQTIDFSHNEIIGVDDEAFVGCPNLEVLDLSHNQLISVGYINFANNPYNSRLLSLNLAHNNIYRIENALAKLRKLEFVNLSGNNINQLTNNNFNYDNEIKSLDLSHNKFDGIEKSVLAKLKHLEKLYLTGNELYGNCLDNPKGLLPQLREISLPYGYCPKISAIIKKLNEQNIKIHTDNVQGTECFNDVYGNKRFIE